MDSSGVGSKRERAYSLLALLLVGCMLVATIWVIFSDYPPVFNQSPKQYTALNFALLGALVIATSFLVLHVIFGHLAKTAKIVKIVLLTAITINVLFGLLERFVVGIDGAKLIHNFRNATVDGVALPLQQSNKVSQFGFRMEREEPLSATGFRYLMLGNSYTRGSGRTFETNYPQVVEKFLRSTGGPDNAKLSVFAAGVDGYGLQEDGRLYRLLIENNYKFDAIILNIMMGSDFTNNIPGTMRLALAGEPQRFHELPFLFTAYPLNSYFFRYMLYFKAAFGNAGTPPVVAAPASSSEVAKAGTCVPSNSHIEFVRDRALQYYGPDSAKRIFLEYNLNFADEIIARAKAAGIKTYIVLQSDPNAELDSRRTMLQSEPSVNWDWTKEAVEAHFSGRVPVLNLGPAFRNRDDLFKCNDTHWNDAGNVYAGELVAKWLTEQSVGSKR